MPRNFGKVYSLRRPFPILPSPFLIMFDNNESVLLSINNNVIVFKIFVSFNLITILFENPELMEIYLGLSYTLILLSAFLTTWTAM